MGRKTRVLLALAITLSLLVGAILPAAAQAGEIYVDDDCNPTVQTGTQTEPFCSIQAAIDAGVDGQTISVAAGTYYESLTINKRMALISADGLGQAKLNGNSATENYYMVRIQADGVTLYGFDISNPLYAGTADASGVIVEGRPTGVVVQNCSIHDMGVPDRSPVSFGTFGLNIGPVKDMMVVGNHIYNLSNGAASSRVRGIFFWGNSSTDTVDGVGIVGNTIEGLAGPADRIEAIAVGFYGTNISVASNAIVGPVKRGIVVDAAALGPIAVQGNSIGGATVAGLAWNSTMGGDIAWNTFSSSPAQIISTSNSLDGPTVLGANTFEAPVFVPTTGGWGIYSGLQAAVNAAGENATIIVPAGSYDGNIIINNSDHSRDGLKLQAGGLVTLSGGIGVFDTADVTIEGFTIVGGGAIGGSRNVGIYLQGAPGAEIRGNTITNVFGNQAQGIETAGDVGGLLIADNVVINNQAGIYINPTSKVMISGNLIADNGVAGQSGGHGLGTDGVSDLFLQANTLENNLRVGWEVFTGDTSNNITARFNNFLDSSAVAQSGPFTVNAEHNWWGSADEPSAKVSGLVDYDPWLGAAPAAVAIEQVDNGASTELQVGGSTVVQATYTGSAPATVALATYESNPGSTVIGTEGAFFDVNVSGAPADATLTVKFFLTSDPGPLYWYDGATWRLVRNNDGSKPLYADGYIQATFGPTSSPTVAQLTGTPFGTGAAAQIRVVPADYDVLVPGDKVTVYVEGYASDLYAAEFMLIWDPSMLAAYSEDITLGSWLSPDAVIKKQVDGNVAWVAFSQQGGRASVSGTGYLAAINLTVLQAGTTDVSFSYVKLSDPEGFEIPVDPADRIPGTLTISATGGIKGYATLQGRTNHAGVTIAITPGEVDSVGSNALGAFALTGLRPYAGDYEARASFPGYLTAVHAGIKVVSGTDNELGLIKLLGGDATHDQLINIQDLVFIGAGHRFRQTGLSGQDAWADINGDNTVDILDVALAGVNFGKTAPQPWR